MNYDLAWGNLSSVGRTRLAAASTGGRSAAPSESNGATGDSVRLSGEAAPSSGDWLAGLRSTFDSGVAEVNRRAADVVTSLTPQVDSLVETFAPEVSRVALNVADNVLPPNFRESLERGIRNTANKSKFLPDSANVTDPERARWEALKGQTPDALLESMGRNGIDIGENSVARRLMARLQGPNGTRDAVSLDGQAAMARLAERYRGQRSQTMMNNLERFLESQSGPLDAETRRRLVSGGLVDVAAPTTIEQPRDFGNCGAVGLQRVWAERRPENYLQALTTLGSGQAYRFENGNQLSLTPDQLTESLRSRNLPTGAAPRRDITSSVVMTDALARNALNNGLRSNLVTPGAELLRSNPELLDRITGNPAGRADAMRYVNMFTSYNASEAGRNAPLAPWEIAQTMTDIMNQPFEARYDNVRSRVQNALRTGQPSLVLGVDEGPHYVVPESLSGNDMTVASWGDLYSVNPGAGDQSFNAIIAPVG